MSPCTRDHQFEVVWTGSVPGGPYPPEDTFWGYLVTTCTPEFRAYVGVDQTESLLILWPVFPTAEAWNEGDRYMSCSAFDTNGNVLTESVKGSKR